MPEPVDPRRAIVSIWLGAVGPKENFQGSGAFVSPRLVLTAKHVVENKQPSEVCLGLVAGQHAVPATRIHCHDKCDMALIELEREFKDQDLVRIDCQTSSLEGATLDLYGVNPDTLNRDQCNGYTLGTWDGRSGEYLFDHAQRKGFSGGIAVRDGRAIGVISKRHKTEQQGVIVPLYAVADWLDGFGLQHKPASFVVTGTPVSSLSPISQNEFTRKIREQIHQLLNQPQAQPLCEAVRGRDRSFSHDRQQVTDSGPLEQQRLEKKVKELQEQWDLLSEKLNGLNKDWILETRSEDKLRLKTQIDGMETQRDQIEQQLKNIERQLARVDNHAQTGKESWAAAEALIPQQPDAVINALDRLHHATEDCIQQLTQERKLDKIGDAKKMARAVFGWLVLLAVDRDQVNALGYAFDPWKEGVEVAVPPLGTEAGIEVLVSSLGDRDSRFRFIYDNQKRLRVIGRDSFTADGLEDGIDKENRLEGILRRIWVEVERSEAPSPFGPNEQRHLQAKLAGRERRDKMHHYVTVRPARDSSPLADRDLLQSLLQALPSLRVIYIGREQGGGILLLDEYALLDSIEAFLRMLQDTL